MKQKGILFTTGILAFSLVILAFSLVVLSHNQKMSGAISDTMVFEQVYNKYSSTEHNIRTVFLTTSGINMTRNGSVLIFEERIPNNNHTNLIRKMNYLENFTESYSDNLTHNINLYLDEVKENASIRVLPHNITYTHSLDGNSIYVIPEQMNFNRYDIYIKSNVNITNCDWEEWDEVGNLTVNISVIGNSTISCIREKSINVSLNPHLIVSEIGGGSISIEFKELGWLNITSNLTSLTDVTTKINITEMSNTTRITFTLPGDIIEVRFNEFNITKRGAVFLK